MNQIWSHIMEFSNKEDCDTKKSQYFSIEKIKASEKL